jgi:hypothetical protein
VGRRRPERGGACRCSPDGAAPVRGRNGRTASRSGFRRRTRASLRSGCGCGARARQASLEGWTRGVAHGAEITTGSAPSVIPLGRSITVRRADAAVEMEVDADAGRRGFALRWPCLPRRRSLLASARDFGRLWRDVPTFTLSGQVTIDKGTGVYVSDVWIVAAAGRSAAATARQVRRPGRGGPPQEFASARAVRRRRRR